MSSDKNPTHLSNPNTTNELSSSTVNYINPSNIDYSIIKNFYPGHNYPAQNFINYPPVDMNFQQNSTYNPNNQAYSNSIFYFK